MRRLIGEFDKKKNKLIKTREVTKRGFTKSFNAPLAGVRDFFVGFAFFQRMSVAMY